MSTGVAAMNRPDSPPITNMATNARAHSIGVVYSMVEFHVVPSQLNTFTALGRAIMIVASMNPVPSRGSMPLWNMWWPQTMNPSPAMPAIEYTIGLYPNSGLRANVVRMSLTIPMAGRIMMYTAGWE